MPNSTAQPAVIQALAKRGFDATGNPVSSRIRFRTLSAATDAFDALEAEHATLTALHEDHAAAAKAISAERKTAKTLRAEVTDWKGRAIAAEAKPAPGASATAQLRAELDSANAMVTAAQSEASALRSQIAVARQTAVESTNRRACEILASNGHPPLPLGREPLGDEGNKIDPSLKGRDRMIAAIARDLAAGKQA